MLTGGGGGGDYLKLHYHHHWNDFYMITVRLATIRAILVIYTKGSVYKV